MAKSKKKDKKKATNRPQKGGNQPAQKRAKTVATQKSASPVRSKTAQSNSPYSYNSEIIFGRQNYILMVVGAVFLGLGLLLMSGGSMPSPDVWDDSIIYSFRRITLAPILMIIGLVIEIYAIFKRS